MHTTMTVKKENTTTIKLATTKKITLSPLEKSIKRGSKVYRNICSQCHRPNGKGIARNFPPLAGSNWLTEKRLESMVFKNSRTRIVEFLHSLGKEQGQRVGYETLVRNFFTHQEIADLTGTSRQTVTTTLNELRNQNIITFNRRRLLIRDLSDLYKAAC